MGDQESKQNFQVQDLELKEIDANGVQHDHWVIMEGGDYNCVSLSTGSSSSLEDSSHSIELSSSLDLDLVEDASSPTSSSSSSNGPLYELSELMAQLPIKRGLSKYYQGKSQSYTSLARVTSIEDLVKKVAPYRTRIKPCKSYGGGLDGHKIYTPKATISKKASRGSFLSSLGKRGTS